MAFVRLVALLTAKLEPFESIRRKKHVSLDLRVNHGQIESIGTRESFGENRMPTNHENFVASSILLAALDSLVKTSDHHHARLREPLPN